LDELDRQILQLMGAEVFYEFATHPKWRDVDPTVKKRILNAPAFGDCTSTNITVQEFRGSSGNRVAPSDADDAFLLNIIEPSLKTVSRVSELEMLPYPALGRATVYNWTNDFSARPTPEYIVLPDNIKNGLSIAEQGWARALLYVMNDNINTLIATPSFAVSSRELASGALNGKFVNQVGGIFPGKPPPAVHNVVKMTRMEIDAAWEQSKPVLNTALEKRKIPREIWSMYHTIGYVYVLSDFEGEPTEKEEPVYLEYIRHATKERVTLSWTDS
jgi:hypothetical protein